MDGSTRYLPPIKRWHVVTCLVCAAIGVLCTGYVVVQAVIAVSHHIHLS